MNVRSLMKKQFLHHL